MSKFYFVLRGYFPNTAPTEHCINWINVIEKLHIQLTVFFLRPDTKKSKVVKKYNNVTFVYLWENNLKNPNNRILRFLLHMKNAYLLSKKFKKDDVVWIYDCPEILPIIVRKNGVKVYNEVTEHPDVKGIIKLGKSYLRIIDKSYKKLYGLFVISTSLKRTFIERGVCSENIHIINMTVNPYRFLDLSKNVLAQYIVYCGNGANNKDGVDILIKAFAMFKKKISGYKLLIIGPETIYGDSSGNRELIEKLGIADSIIFTGRIDSEKVPQMLINAKILALARPNSIQAQNGFPTKLGEYLMTGNPVITTSVGDIPLFLEDKKSALLAKPNDIIDFANKMEWVHNNYDQALNIGIEGKKIAMKYFNPLTEMKKMLKYMNYNVDIKKYE